MASDQPRHHRDPLRDTVARADTQPRAKAVGPPPGKVTVTCPQCGGKRFDKPDRAADECLDCRCEGPPVVVQPMPVTAVRREPAGYWRRQWEYHGRTLIAIFGLLGGGGVVLLALVAVREGGGGLLSGDRLAEDVAIACGDRKAFRRVHDAVAGRSPESVRAILGPPAQVTADGPTFRHVGGAFDPPDVIVGQTWWYQSRGRDGAACLLRIVFRDGVATAVYD